MDITPDLLLKAYACGVFPMAESADAQDVFWVDPNTRGILPLDGVHIPRRLRKTIRTAPYDVRVDTAFDAVLDLCAETTANRKDTWINPSIRALYVRLFQMGQAHSVECWKDGALVGGLYGVKLAGAFFGESMFHRATDASKIALIYLVARLNFGGFRLLDTQFTTPHLEQFGTQEISREAYQDRLSKALKVSADFYRLPLDASPSAVLQSVTQRS